MHCYAHCNTSLFTPSLYYLFFIVVSIYWMSSSKNESKSKLNKQNNEINNAKCMSDVGLQLSNDFLYMVISSR